MRFDDFDFPSRRSSVAAYQGMAATSQPLAVQAGLATLQQGGNAVDAALTMMATLCVVEPCSTGIGGDAFALIWWARDRRLYGLNGSGPMGRLFAAETLREQGQVEMPTTGGLSVTVPGSLRAWELALNRFGSRGLDTLLQPAIHYAREGFPVSPLIARQWALSVSKMSRHPDSVRVWLPGGQAPPAATRFRNPEFARTLQTLAEEGFDAFYIGPIARQIVACVQADGGCLTLEDLATYQAEWVASLQTSYRAPDGQVYELHEIPPNSQGLAALLALNLAQELGVGEMAWGSADYWHGLIEAMKLAFADAQAYVADPRQATIPLAGLLHPAYTRARRAAVQPRRAGRPTAGRPLYAGDTVYLTVADGDGNMVSWIQSLYMGFGSGLTAGTTGVQLQNRAANFSLEPGHPNEAAPGKRPYNTIIPGFITRDGEAWASLGVMGGFMQPQGHLQVGLNLMAFGMDPQTALAAPRFNWLQGQTVGLETLGGWLPAGVVEQLRDRGHDLRLNLPPGQFGGGQVIVRDPATGVLLGGSEPRKDGCALGF